MNREDIIRMAREASNTPIDHHATPDLFGVAQIERFFQAAYAAGAAAERKRVRSSMKKAFRRMAGLIRADEREQCAKVCDEEGLLWGQRYAAAIRARGQF